MRLSLICVMLIFPVIIGWGQVSLDYYLPDQIEFDPLIPTPASIIGHEVGEWHVSHDKLVLYLKSLALVSNRITIEEYGKTYENRPLLLLTITSPQNQSNISQIMEDHHQLSDPAISSKLNTRNMPVVIWLGYSVHGNEPSGSNASLLVAYYLAAARGKEIEETLNNCVILLDPSINPDGLNRFASWVNSHKSQNLISDPNSREHKEAWPRGRTNHYWFDLNRDWLPLQHPESKARIEKFHIWKPNILTDHHEMGTNSTFFFQPGIPSRNHPLIPASTLALTQTIGTYHARALDQIGSLYYSKESFDDFYYGKGSTYPDINGSIGILFEQASSRGHSQESVHGTLSFPFTIRNHFTVSLSTIKAGKEQKEKLLKHQSDFYQSANTQAKQDPVKAYVFGSEKDLFRVYHFAEILHRHQIKIYDLKKSITINQKSYKSGAAYVVPLNQMQYKLIKDLFESRTQFQDSLFYDVSAWTLPLAFNLNHQGLNAKLFSKDLLGEPFSLDQKPTGKVVGGVSNYVYVFEWDGYYTPYLLNKLLEQQLLVKVANEPFTDSQGRKFSNGSILVPVNNQKIDPDQMYNLLNQLVIKTGTNIYTLKTGQNQAGVDLGSPKFSSLKEPKICILVDEGISGYEVGEVWHLLDVRYDMKLSMIPQAVFNLIDLTKYNTIILVDGKYQGIDGMAKQKLQNWIKNGGTIIAVKKGAKWLANNGIGKTQFKTIERDSSQQRSYSDLQKNKGSQNIGGAIFEANLDLSHPLTYGYNKRNISLFRNHSLIMQTPKNPYAYPIVYTSNPLKAGYTSSQNLQNIANTPALTISAWGKGRIISFVDNPNFRAFWYGTNKLFMNSIFFGPIVDLESAK